MGAGVGEISTQIVPDPMPTLAGLVFTVLPMPAHSVFGQRVDIASIIDRVPKGIEFWRQGLRFSTALMITLEPAIESASSRDF